MKHLLGSLPFLALTLPMLADASGVVESGHTGIWRDATRSGEGITLEILDAHRASLAWFTYDDAGGQRWAFALGEIVRDGDGAHIVFEDIYTMQGGRFGDAYDPATVQATRVGAATLRFADCNQGEFAFDAFGQQMTLAYERLTKTMGAGCAPLHGIPGEAIRAHAGQSGIWSDPQRRGQGFQLQWTTRNDAVLGWYTFDRDGKAYWLTGVGALEDGRIVFRNLIATRGAKFGTAFDPADVQVIDWGRLELVLDCDSGTARYDSESFGSGEQPLYLLTRSVPVSCPYAAPKLTDLYDVTVHELPIEPTVPPSPDGIGGSSNVLIGQDVADDGTVVGTRKRLTGSGESLRTSYWPIRLRRGQTAWQQPANVQVGNGVFLSADADHLLAAAHRGVSTSYIIYEPVQIRPGRAEALSGLIFDTTSRPHGMSEDGRFVVGEGSRRAPDGDGWIGVPWIWDAEGGQRELPLSEEVPGPMVSLVSNAGDLAFGSQPAWGEFPGFPSAVTFVNHAVVWEGEGAPRALRDPAGRYLGYPIGCSTDCDIVIGSGSWAEWDEAAHVLRGESGDAWYRKRSGEVGYLDGTPPASLATTQWRYVLTDVSGDGGLVAGYYQTPGMENAFPNGASGFQALLWSQNTGFVPLQSIIEATGELEDWPATFAMAISPNGEWVLLSSSEYYERAGRGSPSLQRNALLRLTPKAGPAR